MRHIIFVILAMTFCTSGHAETTKEPITFKGIALGQAGKNEVVLALCKEKESNLENGILYNCDRKKYIKNNWSFKVDYGSLVDVYASLQFDDNDAIQQIEIRTVPKASIPNLTAAIESKYGKPTIANAIVENKFGMKFDNVVYTWMDAEGNRITVESIYDKVTNGRVLIESAERVNMQKKLNEILKEAGKANL